MLAHNYQKSKFGIFGFDTINIFTNDEIYCSGFLPTVVQIDEIGRFIQTIKSHFLSELPIHLYITKRKGLYYLDAKVTQMGDPIFTDSHGPTLVQSLSLAQKKLIQNSPQRFYQQNSMIDSLFGQKNSHCYF
jgi:hypothetical protein